MMMIYDVDSIAGDDGCGHDAAHLLDLFGHTTIDGVNMMGDRCDDDTRCCAIKSFPNYHII